MAESKTKAFRTDEETSISLDKWVAEHGLRNNEVLPTLLRQARLAEERGKLTGRADEIDNVKNLLEQIEIAYIGSLNLASAAHDNVRAEFTAKLEQRDATILNLQEQLAKAKEESTVALKSQLEAAQSEITELRLNLKNARAEAELAQKDAVLKVRQEMQADADKLRANADKLRERLDALTDKYEKALQKLS